MSSSKFGKAIVKKQQEVDTSMHEGTFVTGRSIDGKLVRMESTFDKVWKCIIEEKVGIIGLYGMGGVG